MHHRQRQSGFSLFEVFIALIVVGIITTIVSGALGSGLRYWGKIETDRILKDLRQSLVNAYRENMILVESDTGRKITLPDGIVQATTRNAAGICNSTTTSLAPLGRYLSSSAGVSYLDGYSVPICILITPQQTMTLNGTTVTYHTIAIISGGNDNFVEAGTTLSDTGVLTLAGDDRGVLIDGRSLAQDRLAETQAKMAKIVDALQAYFTTRYQGNATRDISVDYFASQSRSGAASPLYDTSGAMPTTGGAAISMTAINAHTILGLSTQDVTDGYGNVFQIDNSSNAVRNPENSTAALATPPFSARISTTLPGTGAALMQTAVGSY